MIRFRTLGRVDLDGLEREAARSVLRAPKRLGLLSYLVLARPAGYQRRDALLALFWPESDAERARHALRNTLYELRRALGGDVLPGRGQDEVGVAADRLRCDALAFEEALEEGRDEAALELYRGELLPGLHVSGAARAFEEWLEGERRRLRRRAGEAARRLAARAEASGDLGEAVRWCRRAVSLAPYDEAPLRRLMEVLARAGSRAEAVRAYEEFAERASTELGVRPGPETRALAASVRAPEEAGGGAPAEARDADAAEEDRPREPADASPSPGPSRPPIARPTSPRWSRPAGVGAAVVALAAVVAALLGGTEEPSADTTPPAGERVAVFPFAVQGEDGGAPAVLSGGLATLLAVDLDGTGGLRAVDPRALRGRREGGGAIDPGEAGEVSRRLGAGLYVLGDAVSAAGRVRLAAALHRPGTDSVLARASVEGPREGVFRLVDRLAAELLAARYPERELPLVRRAARTTNSLEALKAYLEGEESFRAGRFASAVAAYREAVEADSSFALAHHRLSVTAEWIGDRTTAREAAERAVRRASRLPERERKLLSAHLTSLRGDAREAERQYRAILGTYPNDLEAWYQLGEILFHYGPAVGRSIREARTAFEEVAALSPDHVPSLVHLARIAAAEGRPGEVARLAERVLALAPGSARAWEMRALEAHTGETRRTEREELIGGLRDASDRSVRLATWNVAVFAEDPEGAARLAELLTAPWRSPEARRLGREWLAELAVARGRWSEAREVLVAGGPGPGGAFHAHRGAFLAALPFLAVDEGTISALRERLAGGPGDAVRPGDGDGRRPRDGDGLAALGPRLRLFSAGLLASRAGDFGPALDRAEALEAPPGSPSALPLAGRLARIVRAHVAWRRGDPGRGLEILGGEDVETRSSLMYGVDYVQPFERYLRARLLEEAGRGGEALQWLSSFRHQHVHHLVYLAPSHLRRARILEARGEREAALRHYRAFLDLWRSPDPGLRPLRRAAERRVERLGTGADDGAP